MESSLGTLSVLRKQDKYQGFASALTVPILCYFESRRRSDLEARINVRKVLRNLTIIDLTDELIQKAFDEENIPDFEDCIQYHSAKAALCSLIITRNTRDFQKTTIDICTPEEFLSIVRPNT